MVVEGGILPGELPGMTFWEIDLRLQRQKWLIENDWERTRLIISALTGKRATEIIQLERDEKRKKVWTQEEALGVLKRYGDG